MSDDNYHKDRIANRRLHPETLMMGFGYSPAMSEGSLKPPVFLTSTFVFENAQQGKDFFDLTAGRRQLKPGEKSGLVYSRFNHPNMEISEDRLGDLGRGREMRRLRQRHGGDRDDLLHLPAAGRHRHPQPAALWRHGDPFEEPDGRLRRHALRLHRRHRRRADAGGRRGRRGQGPGRHDPGRDAGQSDQRARRSRRLRRDRRRTGKVAGPSPASGRRQHHARADVPEAAEARGRPQPAVADQICRRSQRSRRRLDQRVGEAGAAGQGLGVARSARSSIPIPAGC